MHPVARRRRWCGELALLVAGVAAERGDASLPVIVALAWGAAVAGDVVSLLLGRRFLERHGPRFRLGAPQLTRIEGFFGRHECKAVLLGRVTGFLRATLPFVAGSSGMPLRRLPPASAISALVWTVTFIVIGYVFSESFTSAGETATRWALVLILVTAAGLVMRSRLASRRSPRGER